MMRVADYVAHALADHGIRHVFLVTGGGAMHLNDAIGRCRELEYIANHHEQACAMAAQGYFRATGKLAAVNVTTGPGGTNAITGVYGAWVDSLGMVVISGQVKYETLVRSTALPLRQLGDQEVDITKLVGSITKYAHMVTEPESIRFHLEKAIHLARTGRPGPVWLDIPINVQFALVDPEVLQGYIPEAADDPAAAGCLRGDALARVAVDVLARLRRAERPVILPGSGVRLANAFDKFNRVIDRLSVPVATAFNAHDLVPYDHPLYAGKPGTVGDRPGNFAVQNSDFLLVLGCRLNIRQISYNWQSFARAAYKVMVDVDAAELQKPTLTIDQPVHADLDEFFDAILAAADTGPTAAHRYYVAWCKERVERYPVVLPEYWQEKARVNPYCFSETLFSHLPEDELVVTGDGTACVVTFQAAKIKRGQRLFTDSGSAPMGFDLPGAIGACVGMNKKRVVCLAGDGSIQMNLQELQTIATHRLPIKIFLFNNQGYHSIRQTQQNYFPDNVVGCGTESGLGFPDFEKLASVYGLPYARIDNHDGMDRAIKATLDVEGPAICEVMLDLTQAFAPKLSSRKLPDGRMITSSLEDLAPFLDREELAKNMLIPMVER